MQAAVADKVVVDVLDNIDRLRQVLEGVEIVLKGREQKGVASKDDNDIQAQKRIQNCSAACILLLNDLNSRVGVFDLDARGLSLPNLLKRVKIAIGQPRILRIQSDLEARVSSLQTELSLLHLYDHANATYVHVKLLSCGPRTSFGAFCCISNVPFQRHRLYLSLKNLRMFRWAIDHYRVAICIEVVNV